MALSTRANIGPGKSPQASQGAPAWVCPPLSEIVEHRAAQAGQSATALLRELFADARRNPNERTLEDMVKDFGLT